MDTHSQNQELTNNLEIENSQNKSHTKISEFTVFKDVMIQSDIHWILTTVCEIAYVMIWGYYVVVLHS